MIVLKKYIDNYIGDNQDSDNKDNDTGADYNSWNKTCIYKWIDMGFIENYLLFAFIISI